MAPTTTNKARAWVEAMRLRTLPVSLAGVIAAYGYCILGGVWQWAPAVLCALFAILAQIASNFANEYFDYRAGLDRPGRVGPRRGVTEGDITPEDMLYATLFTLGLAAVVGCSLIWWGGWWLLAAGALIVVAVLAYSAGPFPLSRHCLGEVAVVVFFGIAPVCLTYYVMSGMTDWTVFMGSISLGLMGANVLIVNNYRDINDDRAVGKMTLAVVMGRKFMGGLYLFNGYIAIALMAPLWLLMGGYYMVLPVVYAVAHTALWVKITTSTGQRLNPMLGATAMNMLYYALAFLTASILTTETVFS